MIEPFSEVNLFEQGNISDPFFATGSLPSIGDDESFVAALKDKEQIRLSFNVNNKVKMLGNSSSIYYFNINKKQWNIPQGALGDITSPFDKLSFLTYGGNFSSGLNDPLNTVGTIGSYCFEDKIGFDCYGNPIASGNLDIHRFSTMNRCQTINDIGQVFSFNDVSDYRRGHVTIMSDDYHKSVQRNESFNASNEELFTLPIERPFLLEKIVIQIPFCFGKNWFYDKTTTRYVQFVETRYRFEGISGGTNSIAVDYMPVDEGGPALSLSLMCQKQYGTSSIRDLVCSNLITHNHDIFSDGLEEIDVAGDLKEYFTGKRYWMSTINGVARSLQDTTDFTIIDNSWIGNLPAQSITGSFLTKMSCNVSNGLKVNFIETITANNIEKSVQIFKQKLENEYISLSPINESSIDAVGTSNYTCVPIVTSVDPFCRGMTGFSPSGGSIFSSEYSTSQGIIINNSVKNPFYIKNEDNKLNQIEALYKCLNNRFSDIVKISAFSLASKKSSPYLVNPGDKLFLAISKGRPSYKTLKDVIIKEVIGDDDVNVKKGIGKVNESLYYIDELNETEGHDVQLSTGSINITFYGSYVRESKEYRP